MDKDKAKEYWNKYKTNPYCECGNIMIRNEEKEWVCQDNCKLNVKE